MATLKAQKLKEDAYRRTLEEGILKILKAQEQILKELQKVANTLETLKTETEGRNVKQKSHSRR